MLEAHEIVLRWLERDVPSVLQHNQDNRPVNQTQNMPSQVGIRAAKAIAKEAGKGTVLVSCSKETKNAFSSSNICIFFKQNISPILKLPVISNLIYFMYVGTFTRNCVQSHCH